MSASLPARQILRRCGGRQCPPGTCDHDGTVRRSMASPARGPATAPPAVHTVLARDGNPLDAGAAAALRGGLGHDFSLVRVHTDAQAAASAEQVGARAYTVGHHIAFAAGQYRPGTAEGRRLLAHELTHVVQQQGRPMGAASVRRQGDDAAGGAAGGAVAQTGRRFTAEGVSVLVRSRCDAPGFGLDTVEDATRDALDKIFNDACIAPDRARQIQRNLTAHGLDLRCRPSATIDGACAESTGFFVPANIITLGSRTFPAHPDVDPICLPLESTILHEIVHMTRGVAEEALPTSCEASCYGVGTAAPDLCLSPIVAPAAGAAAPAPHKDGILAVGRVDDPEEVAAERAAAALTSKEVTA
jgi:Domain of unknown function (DUF4157)